MLKIGLLEATATPEPRLTMTLNSKMRVTFASLPRELRDEIYAKLVTVEKTINAQSAIDFGCPKEWETMRAMFRASPALEKFAIEAYEAFFRCNTFQIVDYGPAFLARKTYYVREQGRSHGWSDMTASVGKILIEHQLYKILPEQKPLLPQLRSLLACRRLFHVIVRVLLPTDERTITAEARSDKGAASDKILRELTQVCRELIEKIGEGLIFETNCPYIGERIKNWAQYMKVCQELREKITC